jgi:DNA-binding response OmpR family regulator
VQECGDPADRGRSFLVIMIVDHDPDLTHHLALGCPEVFGRSNVVVQVMALEAVVPAFEAATPVDIVLLDSRIANDDTDGLRAMEMLQAAGYQGPFVAISNDTQIRRHMVRCGCTAECEKTEPSALGELVERLTGPS